MTQKVRFWKTKEGRIMATLYLKTKDNKKYEKWYEAWFRDNDDYHDVELNKTYMFKMYETGNCEAYLQDKKEYDDNGQLIPVLNDNGYQVQTFVVKSLPRK